MNQIIKTLKTLAIIGIIISGLTILGATINEIVPWIWLTNFFIIIKFLIRIFDFMIDTDTLITLIGLILTIDAAYWVFKGVMLIIHYFRPKS